MLKTITAANFEHGNHFAIARKMVDSLTGKFFCWQGKFDDDERTYIVSRTLESFEKNFIALADKTEDEPAAQPIGCYGIEQIKHYGIEPDDESAAAEG